MKNRKFIALIAHDKKKAEMISLVKDYQGLLKKENIIATKGTGKLIEESTRLKVKKLLSGDKGGDLQIGAEIASGNVKVVIFLRDPLTAHPHEPDINALLKVCDVHNIPLATNLTTAKMLLRNLYSL